LTYQAYSVTEMLTMNVNAQTFQIKYDFFNGSVFI